MSTTQLKLEELIDSIESLKLVKIVTSQEGLINPKTVFQWINKYDAVPFARIPLNAGLSATTKWLADCLESIDFRNKVSVKSFL